VCGCKAAKETSTSSGSGKKRSAGKQEMAANGGKLTVCVGDIHGHADRLYKLWHNLELAVGATTEDFHKCTVIFLGDYCDRGLQTAQVLDFLISLPRRYPQQKHVFLCGNHDLAFAAFVGALPDAPDGFQFKSTWAEFERSQEKEGWWSGDGEEDVHVQVKKERIATLSCSCSSSIIFLYATSSSPLTVEFVNLRNCPQDVLNK
jgi:hypothetical protein